MLLMLLEGLVVCAVLVVRVRVVLVLVVCMVLVMSGIRVIAARAQEGACGVRLHGAVVESVRGAGGVRMVGGGIETVIEIVYNNTNKLDRLLSIGCL
jgi:hypothetical protein